MKNILKYSIILLTTLCYNCGSDDDNAIQNPLIGQWEITSGTLVNNSDKYVYFNTDNTADILSQTTENFRGKFSPNYSLSSNEVIIDETGGQGADGIFSYTIEDNILTLSTGSREIILQHIDNGPELSNWIQELSVLSEGSAPWEGDVDIAFTFDKTKIVYGKSGNSDHIGLINPNTFEEVGQIETAHSARAVEIEKFDVPDRYVFQSDSGSNLFYGYFENSNALSFTSLELGAWILGLASVNNEQIWVSSTNESSLYLYNYGTSAIETTEELNIQPKGLDYQNGFLYVCDGLYIHKCRVSPSFQVLESYALPNLAIEGIAFDGINFWVNGSDFSNDSNKLVKTSLTL
ncbi:hypothetical protein [Winogradskyella forsetii]|uniref:hypothetical protein n=1 Tax=Winogradskyella forsetii TaxID=2686077 RepID=UPI0015C061CD|nr:hypothetical protein [Winogradskyella forsetii]